MILSHNKQLHVPCSRWNLWTLYSLGVLSAHLDYVQNGLNFSYKAFSLPLIWAYLGLYILVFPLALGFFSWAIRRFSVKLDNIFRIILFIFLGYSTARLFLKPVFSPELACILALLLTIGLLWLITTRFGKDFLKCLSPSIVLIPLYFLGFTDIALLAFPHSIPFNPIQKLSSSPVVLIILDELPSVSIMKTEQSFDERWVPNLARFAEHATYYPNTLSYADATIQSLPTIISGRRPPLTADKNSCLLQAPSLGHLPSNLYQYFSPEKTLVHESHTRLCPNTECEKDLYRSDTSQLFQLMGDLFWHEYLPSMTTPLLLQNVKPHPEPDFKQPFWQTIHSSLSPQASPMARDIEFIKALDFQKDPRDLVVIHALIPHNPFIMADIKTWYSADSLLQSSGTQFCKGSNRQECLPPPLALSSYQRHLFQTRVADDFIGLILAKLKASNRYNNSLIIITADHGIDFQSKYPVRNSSRDSLRAMAPVPLLIKYPQQQLAHVDTHLRYLIDIAPTILDVLGQAPLSKLEPMSEQGLSAKQARPSSVLKQTSYLCGSAKKVAYIPADVLAERGQLLAEKHTLFGTIAQNPSLRLSTVPALTPFLGQGLTKINRDTQSSIRMLSPTQFKISQSQNNKQKIRQLPLIAEGVLTTTNKAPLAVFISVNNRIEAITTPFHLQLTPSITSKQWVFSAVVPKEAFHVGINSIEAVAVPLPQKAH